MKSVVTSKKRGNTSKAPYFILLALVVVAVAVYFLRGNEVQSEAPVPAPSPVKVDQVTVVEPANDANEQLEHKDVRADKKTFLDQEALDPLDSRGAPVGKAVPKIKRRSKEQDELQKNYKYPTPGQARLPDGFIVTFKPPAEGRTVKFMVDHEQYVCYPDGTFEIIEHKPVFEDKFEEQMIGLATANGTFLPVVLLNHTEEELKAMLDREVVINPDDDDDVKQKKQAVAEMKKMLKDYLDQGGDYVDFVMEMHKVSKEEKKLRAKGMAKVYDILESGNIEDAKAFIKAYNEVLDESGYPPLKLPKKTMEELYPDGVGEENGLSADTTVTEE